MAGEEVEGKRSYFRFEERHDSGRGRSGAVLRSGAGSFAVCQQLKAVAAGNFERQGYVWRGGDRWERQGSGKSGAGLSPTVEAVYLEVVEYRAVGIREERV